MYLSKNPTYRFWATVYAFPALVPSLIAITFTYFVRPTMKEALGAKGSELGSLISTSLLGLTVVLLVLVHVLALWHAYRGLPAVPDRQPSRDQPI